MRQHYRNEYNVIEKKTFIEETYGPFTVEKAVHLSTYNTYKFAMYTLLDKKFNILSGQHITGIGCKIIKLEKKQSITHKMGQLKLESYLLSKKRPIKKYGVNTFVVDYVWDQVKGKRGFKTCDYNKLKNEIYKFVPEGDMINIDELINSQSTRSIVDTENSSNISIQTHVQT